MSVSKENKIIAQTVLKAFEGQPKVTKYWDDRKESSIDILSCMNRPYNGVDSFSTIGLSDYSIGYTIEEVPLRVEFAGACASEFEYFTNILATCAFNIINLNYSCKPGNIFDDVIEQYIPSSHMKHILFVPPFLWEDKLETISFTNKKVTWLLAIPISHGEFQYAKENGTEALEDLLEKEQVDIFDLMRNPII